MKRILFAINKMNFRPSSGHGIFMKGVVETALSTGNFIDIISDGEPDENFLSEYPINFYFPDKAERISYGKHSALFQFSDSFNFEKSINFRSAIVKALSNHTYDLVICNDTESAFVCYQLELYKQMTVASYAHECASINPELGAGVFKDCYYNLVELMMRAPMTTLIQTPSNFAKLAMHLPKEAIENLYVQPYPLTDSHPVKVKEKEGLLYIGRHEDRKNPAAYIKCLADIKEKFGVELKAKVLTRAAHVKKFEADFAAIGHTNFEIKADVVGVEKAEMIQSSKVAFMPYKNESFGIAVLEALRYMPVVVLDKFDWHYNFHGMANLKIANTKDVADLVWDLNNNYQHNEARVEAEFNEYQAEYESQLMGLINSYVKTPSDKEPRNRLYTFLKENKGKWIKLSDYFKTENTKGVIYLTSDIETIYVNSNWYSCKQTNYDTYLGIPDEAGNLVHEEVKSQDSFSGFFE